MDLANYNFNKDLVIEKLYKVTDNPDESMIIFFENRFDYITKYMAEFFKLKGKLTNVTLNISNPEQGTIKLTPCLTTLRTVNGPASIIRIMK